MKKNVVRILGAVLLMILLIQSVCFADLIGPRGGGYNPIHKDSVSNSEPETPTKIEKNHKLIGISVGNLILLLFLCIITFISLFIVVYYVLNKYSKKSITVNENKVENTDNQSDSEEISKKEDIN